MRHISVFMGVSTAVAMGGCILLEEYNYSDYVGGDSKGGAGGGSSNASSTSSSGAAGAGLMGSGGASSGGGSTPCVPQVCNVQDPNCTGPSDDCSANAQKFGRYGLGGVVGQRVRAIATRPGGGVVIGGEYDGSVELSDGGASVGIPVEDGGAPVGKPFVAGFAENAAALFFVDIGAIGKQKLGSVLGLASDDTNVYAIGSSAIAGGLPKLFVHRFNADDGALNEPGGAMNKWDDYGTITLAADNFAAIGFDSNFVFFAANVADPGIVVTCDHGVAPSPATSQGILYKIDRTDGHCIQNFLLGTTTPTGITFVTAAGGKRLVIVTGFAAVTSGPQTYIRTTVDAFDTADQLKNDYLWSHKFDPDKQTGILAATSVTSDETNAYFAGTFQGTWIYGTTNASIDSVNTNSKEFDTVVAAINGSTGEPIWARRFGGPGWQQPNSVVHKNGQLYMSGITHERMAVDPTQTEGLLCNDGALDEVGCMYLLKLTKDGNSQWGRAFGFDTNLVNRGAVITLDKNDLWLGGTWGGKVDFLQAGTFDTTVTPPNIVMAKFSILP